MTIPSPFTMPTFLTSSRELADYFEACVEKFP